MDRLNGKICTMERSSAFIPRDLQGIMRHLLGVDQVACLVQKDCRYDKALSGYVIASRSAFVHQPRASQSFRDDEYE